MNTPLRNPLQKFNFTNSISNILRKTRQEALRLVHGIDSPSAESQNAFTPPVSNNPPFSSASNDLASMCSSPEFNGHYLNDTPIIKSMLYGSSLSPEGNNSSSPHNTPSVQIPVNSISSIHVNSPQSSSHYATNQNHGHPSNPAAEVSHIIRSTFENALTSLIENQSNENDSNSAVSRSLQLQAEHARQQLSDPTVPSLLTLRQFGTHSRHQATLDPTVSVSTVERVSSPTSSSLRQYGTHSQSQASLDHTVPCSTTQLVSSPTSSNLQQNGTYSQNQTPLDHSVPVSSVQMMSSPTSPVYSSPLCSSNIGQRFHSPLISSHSTISCPQTITTTSLSHSLTSILPFSPTSVNQSCNVSESLRCRIPTPSIYQHQLSLEKSNATSSHLPSCQNQSSTTVLLMQAINLLNQIITQMNSPNASTNEPFDSRVSHGINDGSNSTSVLPGLSTHFHAEPIPSSEDIMNHRSAIPLDTLSTLLSTCQSHLKYDKFSGDSEDYESFKTKFTTLIDSTNTPGDEKARVLLQALDHDVISRLDHVPELSTPNAYELLWESLDAEFSKYQDGVTSRVLELISELQSWPVCDSSSQLRKLYKFLKSHYFSLKQFGQENELEHVSIRMLLLTCFNGKLLETFSTLVYENPKKPIIEQLLDLIKIEIKIQSLQELAKNTKVLYSTYLNSHTSTDRDAEKSDQSATQTQNLPFERVEVNSSGCNLSSNRNERSYFTQREMRFSKQCFFCLSNNHYPENCTHLNSPSEYKRILRRFKLCYNCFGSDHLNNTCRKLNNCMSNCGDMLKHSSLVCNYTR